MQKRAVANQADASLRKSTTELGHEERILKEILLEENHNKFIRSYKFTFWFSINRCISWIYSAISCSSCYF